MKKNLPYLDRERLRFIFDHVYSREDEVRRSHEDERLSSLLRVLKAMQTYNFDQRPDDTREMYGLMSRAFDFEINSAGTTYWLALILAVRELYGFSNSRLKSVMEQIAPAR